MNVNAIFDNISVITWWPVIFIGRNRSWRTRIYQRTLSYIIDKLDHINVYRTRHATGYELKTKMVVRYDISTYPRSNPWM
jgi:hypothetical protein